MLRAHLLSSLLPITLLHAQAPTFVPRALELVSIDADRVDELHAAWPATRIGRLLADPDAAPAATACFERLLSTQIRARALKDALHTVDVEIEPYVLASVLRGSEFELDRILAAPFDQLRSVHMNWLWPIPEDGAGPTTRESEVVTLRCLPKYEGRWAQAFQREVAILRGSRFYDHDTGHKLDGVPVQQFRAKAELLDNGSWPASYYDRWLLHLPGSFVYGPGSPATFGTIGTREPASRARVRMRMNLAGFVEMWQKIGRNVPRDFTALGFETLAWLEWSGHFEGELLQDEFAVEASGELTGITRAVLGGTATPPTQSLPDGAIAQLRGSLDLRTALAHLPTFDGPQVPPAIVDAVCAALDGGYALGCCAPPVGGLIPRVYLSLGVADVDELDALQAKVLEQLAGLEVKHVTYEGVACHILQIPDAPQGLQPAWCVHDGRLHVAESGLSLRAFLKAQDGGAPVMDVGDAPLPVGEGDIVPNLELRFDEAELYRCFYELWLPIFELSGAGGSRPPAITRADLPEPDVFADYCGKSRGVLRRDGDVWRFQHLGALGGPESAALLMTFGPMLSGELSDYQTQRMSRALAVSSLNRAWIALEAFRKREQRWPKDLAELFRAERLPADLLAIPGDDLAETFELANGSEARTSFRYFPEPVAFEVNGNHLPALLVEVRSAPYFRAILTVDGETPEVYGADCQKAIDDF